MPQFEIGGKGVDPRDEVQDDLRAGLDAVDSGQYPGAIELFMKGAQGWQMVSAGLIVAALVTSITIAMGGAS